MSLLLRRRSCLSISRPCRVGGFAAPEHRGAPFCSSSSLESPGYDPDQWYDYERQKARYEPRTRESVHVVLSPMLDLTLRHAAGLTPKLNKEESLFPDIPFVILGKPCDKRIILKRNFFEESIQIQVDIVDDEDRQMVKTFTYDRFDSISLIVTIVKEEQSSPLELSCTAYPNNSIIVHNVVMKSSDKSSNLNAYTSPISLALGDNMKKDILEFLAQRGINSSLVNFLHDYMFDKSIEYVLMRSQNMKAILDS